MLYLNSEKNTVQNNSLRRLAKGICCAALVGAPLMFGTGCSDAVTDTGPTDSVESHSQGLDIRTRLDSASDADAFRIDVDQVDCADGSLIKSNAANAETGLEDMMLPGGIPQFENAPYDEDSNHLFADQYFVLDAGCYDVEVTPLKAVGGAASEDCDGASASGVEVLDGKTTEIHLISQCRNEPVGGLDVIASLNHAPQVEALVFQPSKFTRACEPTTVCFTASDPDGDPLEVEWTLSSGDADAEVLTNRSRYENGNKVTECVDIESDTPGTYEYTATVFDLLHDDNGDLIRFETYYDDNGEPGRTSRDELEFPIHVGENDGAQCDLD